VHEAKAVGHLECGRRGPAHREGVGLVAVLDHHVDKGPESQPSSELIAGVGGEQVHRLPAHQVHDERPIAMPPPPCEFVDAYHDGSRQVEHLGPLYPDRYARAQ